MRKSTPSKKTPRDLDEAETVECPTCHDVFLHRRSLERHMTVEHGPKVFYWCGQCEHRNNRRDNLRAHYRDCHSTSLEEVDHIRAESYESRERARRSKSEESSRRRSKEKGSSSSGRRNDRSAAKGDEKKRSRENGDSGGRSAKKHARRAPETVSRAPKEQHVESSGDNSGQRDAPECQDVQGNAETTTENEVTVQKEEERLTEEVAGHTMETQFGAIEQGDQEVAEIALTATPTRWEDEELSLPSGGQPVPVISGGKPRGMMKMMEQKQRESADDEEREGESVESLPVSDTPFQLGRLLPGQLVRWKETRESYIYRSKDKIIRGETTREYDVVYLRPCTKPEEAEQPAPEGRLCRLVRVSGEQPGKPLADNDIADAMIGNVQCVTEATTREVFCEGKKVTKDKTKRVFDCAFQAGVAMYNKP